MKDKAISDVLLAAATNRQLLVYELGSTNPSMTVKIEAIDSREIHMERSWIPQTVAILYQDTRRHRQGDSAWVAVGGKGNIGIQLFSYEYNNGWRIKNAPCELECPNNLGYIRLVTFSPSPIDNKTDFLVLGVTMSNQLHCWQMGEQNIATGAFKTTRSSWVLHRSSRRDEPVSNLF